MAYSTVAQVREQTPFKDSTLIGDAYITETIAEVDSMIDGVLREVYTLPLSSTPNSIRLLSRDMASCLLYLDQNPNLEIADGVKVTDWWKDLLGQLEAIRTRKLKLIGSDGEELGTSDRINPSFYPNAASSSPSAADSTAPKFSMNKTF